MFMMWNLFILFITVPHLCRNVVGIENSVCAVRVLTSACIYILNSRSHLQAFISPLHKCLELFTLTEQKHRTLIVLHVYLTNLVNIGIDETSYKKGHKYITVIVNHDTNTVVWASEGHGKSVLQKFYRQLTKEQLASIKVVTGDGAKWITECVNNYTPDCARCVDSFHVVEWAMAALDEVRRDVWHDAYDEYKQLKKANI